MLHKQHLHNSVKGHKQQLPPPLSNTTCTEMPQDLLKNCRNKLDCLVHEISGYIQSLFITSHPCML